jgi:hypothetical protein
MLDAYAAKLSADGGHLIFATLLGGQSADQGSAVAVDGRGNVFVAGFTLSADFPKQNSASSFTGRAFLAN